MRWTRSHRWSRGSPERRHRHRGPGHCRRDLWESRRGVQAVGALGMSIRRLLAGGMVIVALGALAACSSTSSTPPPTALGDDAITVGSFDFPESTLLAEMYSQAIESKGFEVERQFGIGPRELVLPAMSAGFIEFVPEYLGTARAVPEPRRRREGPDAPRSIGRSTRPCEPGTWSRSPRRPAQDANAFFVTSATADRFGLQTLSDVAKVDQDLTFGGPAECASRPLCLLGLHDEYGLTFKHVASPRRRRPADASGTPRGRNRHRTAVHHRSCHRQRRLRPARRRQSSPTLRERHTVGALGGR